LVAPDRLQQQEKLLGQHPVRSFGKSRFRIGLANGFKIQSTN
jgi:hypothetical protein